MAWDKTLPLGSTKIKDSDNQIRANWAAIEAVIGSIADPSKFSIDADGNVDMHSHSINNVLAINSVLAAELSQLETMGATTISAAQWGYFSDLETILGTILSSPTSIQGAIQGDTTKGRIFRSINFEIDNGTNDFTLKCASTTIWNGDDIAQTDNIGKDGTTGDFSLRADGVKLTIETSGLTGNCVFAFGSVVDNASAVSLNAQIYAQNSDIVIYLNNSATGAAQDITALVDTGTIRMYIIYITDG